MQREAKKSAVTLERGGVKNPDRKRWREGNNSHYIVHTELPWESKWRGWWQRSTLTESEKAGGPWALLLIPGMVAILPTPHRLHGPTPGTIPQVQALISRLLQVRSSLWVRCHFLLLLGRGGWGSPADNGVTLEWIGYPLTPAPAGDGEVNIWPPF